VEEGRDDVAVPVLAMFAAADTQIRWALNNGVWAFGAESYGDLLRKTRHYTLEGIAHRITAPTLIMDAENDQFFKGQPQEAEKALVNAPTTLVTLTDAEGAGEHCHMGAMLLAHQTMFDWLDDTLPVG
jgi:dienelactone hydrolase